MAGSCTNTNTFGFRQEAWEMLAGKLQSWVCKTSCLFSSFWQTFIEYLLWIRHWGCANKYDTDIRKKVTSTLKSVKVMKQTNKKNLRNFPRLEEIKETWHLSERWNPWILEQKKDISGMISKFWMSSIAS